jgi:CubicO group peptidase (beta-lactamase class C family)
MKAEVRLTAIALSVLVALPAAAGVSQYRLPAGAADYEDPYIAAGFRALFTCSAHFLMQRPLEDIHAVELADTLPLGLPEPLIDETRGLVQADDGEGNRVTAVFRDTMGCTLLPPDWSESDIPRLPYVHRERPAHDAGVDYPLGDRVEIRSTSQARQLLDRAFDGRTYGDRTLTAGIIIIRDGRIVAERYRDGFGPHLGYRTWSTAKSISASLIGIAAAEGLIDLDAAMPLNEWDQPADPRRAITWKQLLWMSSGLYSQGSNTNAVYFAGQDARSSATGTPLEAPAGERWRYANNDTLLLLLGLRQALADDLEYLRYPYDRLLHRIGMYHTWMETDHAGNFIGSSQVYTTARDLGRFGLLYLQDGIWDGERVLPEGWAEFVARPAPAFEREASEEGYGAQFWLYDGVAGLPPGTYSTAGNKGQHATIIPAHEMVVVRTGVDPIGYRFDQPRFVRDAIEVFARD